MHTASVTKEIAAPIEAVWSVLDDFGGVETYNPNVVGSRIVGGPDTGTGARRECVFHDGGRIQEEITSYEPEAAYTVEFTDVGDFPLKRNVVEISVESVDDRLTAVTMTARFTPKFGPVGWILATLTMKPKFRQTFEEVLDGLESYVAPGSNRH